MKAPHSWLIVTPTLTLKLSLTLGFMKWLTGKGTSLKGSRFRKYDGIHGKDNKDSTKDSKIDGKVPY